VNVEARHGLIIVHDRVDVAIDAARVGLAVPARPTLAAVMERTRLALLCCGSGCRLVGGLLADCFVDIHYLVLKYQMSNRLTRQGRKITFMNLRVNMRSSLVRPQHTTLV